METQFEQEILEQPQVLTRLVRERRAEIAGFSHSLRRQPPRFILIAARGTSDNAALYAKYLFGALNGIPVALGMPSLYTLYGQPPDMRGGLVLGISQSGQTPDVLAVLEEAGRQGVQTVSITNSSGSPLDQVADFSIDLGAGEERSVPASKTYTAQLTAIALLAALWREDATLLTALEQTGEFTEQVLAEKPKLAQVAERFGGKDRLVVVGRGFNYCTTFEVALKVKELSYMAAQAYSAADFRHGPIALLEPGYPVVAVMPTGAAFGDMQNLLAEARASGADLLIFSNSSAPIAQTQEQRVQLPPELPEPLSPIVAVVPGQLLALELARVKGQDPDAPRGLQKVTRTL